MLHRLKGQAGFPDLLYGYAHQDSDGRSSHYVFMIMTADDLKLLHIQDRLRFPVMTVNDLISVHENTGFQLFPAAEIQDLAL